MRYLVSSPAVDRPGWVLDGLNGVAGWGGDAAEVLAPEFAAVVPPEVFAERVRQRAVTFAPGTVTGLDTSDHAARARVRVRDGSVQVVTCAVEPRGAVPDPGHHDHGGGPAVPDAAAAGGLHRVRPAGGPRCGHPADRVLRPAGNGQEHAGRGGRAAVLEYVAG